METFIRINKLLVSVKLNRGHELYARVARNEGLEFLLYFKLQKYHILWLVVLK